MPQCSDSERTCTFFFFKVFSQWLPPPPPPPWLHYCYQEKREGGGTESCNVGIKLTLAPLQFTSPSPNPTHSLTHSHTHTHARTHTHVYTLAGSTHPGTQRCRAKNGALLRLTQCGVLKFPAIKNVIGKIPIKMCEERGKSLPANKRMRKQRRGGGGGEGGGGGWESVMEKEGVSQREVRGREGSGRGGWGIFSSLTTGYPATPLHETKNNTLASVAFSLTPLFLHFFFFFFFKSCFHLAHGSAPSNSWVSQTKSYFLIHSLSHIIILLDCVSQFFF